MSSAAGPDRPKCVQRSEPAMRARRRPDAVRTSRRAGTESPESAQSG